MATPLRPAPRWLRPQAQSLRAWCAGTPSSSPRNRPASRLTRPSNHIRATETAIPNASRCSRPRNPYTQTPHARTYYSAAQTPPPPYPPAETAILSAAYAHVPTHGFTTTALLHGARDAGYLPSSTNLFPRGAFELLLYHLQTQRLALAAHFEAPPDGPSTPAAIQARTQALLLHRLRANAPILPHLGAALAQMAQPSCVPPALAELGRLADDVAYLSGSTALDAGWYAHRAGLAAVYAASEVFMTQDTSAGCVDTEGFVERRLEGLWRGKEVVEGVGAWVGFEAASFVNLARSWGMRI